MNPRSLHLLDRLDEQLRHLLCEVRLADSLIGVIPQTLEIDTEDMATVLGRIVRQLQAARSITRRLHNHRR